MSAKKTCEIRLRTARANGNKRGWRKGFRFKVAQLLSSTLYSALYNKLKRTTRRLIVSLTIRIAYMIFNQLDQEAILFYDQLIT